MSLNKKQRALLAELQGITNQLGSSLDATSTNPTKFIDRQRGLMDVSHILYAVLCDHPENDDIKLDYERAEESIEKLRQLCNKQYTDRNGNV